MDYRDADIACPACGSGMARRETVSQDNGPRIELYQCSGGCGRKAALIHEPGGGLTEDQKSFVEREVARLGAFFPADYLGPPSRR